MPDEPRVTVEPSERVPALLVAEEEKSCGREVGRRHRFVCVRAAGHENLDPPVPHLYRGSARQ